MLLIRFVTSKGVLVFYSRPGFRLFLDFSLGVTGSGLRIVFGI